MTDTTTLERVDEVADFDLEEPCEAARWVHAGDPHIPPAAVYWVGHCLTFAVCEPCNLAIAQQRRDSVRVRCLSCGTDYNSAAWRNLGPVKP